MCFSPQARRKASGKKVFIANCPILPCLQKNREMERQTSPGYYTHQGGERKKGEERKNIYTTVLGRGLSFAKTIEGVDSIYTFTVGEKKKRGERCYPRKAFSFI